MQELVNQTEKTDNQFRRDAELKLGMELFPDFQNHSQSPQTVQIPVKTTVAPLLDKKTSEGFQITLQRYLDWKRMEDVRAKTIQEEQTIIAGFFEIVGDTSISEITKNEVNHYIEVQSKLPLNRKKNPKYRDFSIDQLVRKNLPKEETQSNHNINKRLTRLTTFGHGGIRQGFIDSNPFKGMKQKVKVRPQDQRERFSELELKKKLTNDSDRI